MPIEGQIRTVNYEQQVYFGNEWITMHTALDNQPGMKFEDAIKLLQRELSAVYGIVKIQGIWIDEMRKILKMDDRFRHILKDDDDG